MVKKIALEEHVLTPGLIDYWRPTMTTVPPALTADLFKKLNDFGDMRLENMDKSGIARAVLSVAGPGVQAERDAAVATRKAKRGRTTSSLWKSRSGRTAMRVLPISRYRIRRRPPTNSSAACAI